MTRSMQAVLTILFCLLAAVAALISCVPPATDQPPLQTVDSVDLDRYLGTWYEIARLPHPFQGGCVATRAIYTRRDDGLIGVFNECREDALDGSVRSVEGRARVTDPQTNARLEVSFFWLFWGDYWVIDLDPDYRWAVVGHPSRRYLWVLAREPSLDPVILKGILQRVAAQGYDLDQVIYTEQSS